MRNGVAVDNPLAVVLHALEAGWVDAADPTASFGEPDLRRANRGGARISAAEIAAVLARRRAIERALRAIPPDASLLHTVPWQPLADLFACFADIRGIGFAKTTKTLHPKRPALIPMLDSVVLTYLADDDPGREVTFADRAIALVRGYKLDLDRNRAALRAVRKQIALRGYTITDVRVLDVVIWSAFV